MLPSFQFYLPSILFSPLQDDMAPEELLFEFSRATAPLKLRETSFAFVELIQSLAGSLKPAAPWKGWDNTIPAIHSSPVSLDSQQI